MKITKSRFLGQNHGGHKGEQANFLSSGDKIFQVPSKEGKPWFGYVDKNLKAIGPKINSP